MGVGGDEPGGRTDLDRRAGAARAGAGTMSTVIRSIIYHNYAAGTCMCLGLATVWVEQAEEYQAGTARLCTYTSHAEDRKKTKILQVAYTEYSMTNRME